jgi:hypothetical protein
VAGLCDEGDEQQASCYGLVGTRQALGTAALPSTVWQQQLVRRAGCFSVVNFPSTRSYPRRLQRKGLPLRAHAYSSISFRYIICLDTLTLPPTGWMGRYTHCLIQLPILQHHYVAKIIHAAMTRAKFTVTVTAAVWDNLIVSLREGICS